MEYNFLLVVTNTILLVGAGVTFIVPLRKRERWWLWLPVGALLCLLTMWLGYHSHGTAIFVYYLMTYLAVVLVTNRATRLSLMDSCYCAVWIIISAIAVQEAWMGFRLACAAASLTLDLRSGAELLVFSGVMFAVKSRTVARWMPKGDLYQVSLGQFISAVLLGGMFVALSHVFMLPTLKYSAVRVVIALCQTCCLLLLLLSVEANKRLYAERRLDILNLMCDVGAQQYALGQRSMEIVNRKCEELERQISRMEQVLPEEFRTEADSAIREARLACDSVVKTGHSVLDIVLTEKKLLAETKQAQINCVADGRLLDFMDTVDIYTLFAYGMDTALEDVEQIADESHRFIDLLIHESQNFLVISTSHPLQSAAAMKKRNTLNNYKIMVIHRIVEKYHGMVSLQKEEKLLTLKILIPLAQNRR